MKPYTDEEYFDLRKEGKIYISKVFSFDERNYDPVRYVRIVFEGSDSVSLGEIEGSMCLRLTGEKRKTQVTALISQDDRRVRRLTLETFQSRSGDRIKGYEKDSFSFRQDEFSRLLEFLSIIKFIDLENQLTSSVEDFSKVGGRKVIVDAADRDVIELFRSLDSGGRARVIESLQGSLTADEVNVLLGRRQALATFEERLHDGTWDEKQWQDFFEAQPWVFGYGLDYRIMRQFDREAVVSSSGPDNKEKSTVDFLMSFHEYTVLVEIKRPDTPIFQTRRGGRSGTWSFSNDFTDAISQILEQKSEWAVTSQSSDLYNRSGTKKLASRTRDAKAILVIGRRSEFSEVASIREAEIRADTFELFRRDTRNIEILTYDELYERAQFILR